MNWYFNLFPPINEKADHNCNSNFVNLPNFFMKEMMILNWMYQVADKVFILLKLKENQTYLFNL